MNDYGKNSAAGGGVGTRQPSLGSFPDSCEEQGFPTRSASRATAVPAGVAGATGPPTGGTSSFLRSMFGGLGNPSRPIAMGGGPGMHAIKTPQESPSHPELVFSPTDVGVWEFSRFTPTTPKSHKDAPQNPSG